MAATMKGPILYLSRYLLPISAAPLEDAGLMVDEGCIVAIGSGPELLAENPGVTTVDLGDSIILPPMVNAHTHLELTDYPQWEQEIDDLPVGDDFVDWILRMIAVRRHVSRERYRDSLVTGLSRSLGSGTAAVGDILTTLSASEAYAGSRMRGRAFCEVIGRDPDRVAERLAQVEALLSAGSASGMTYGLSPHAPYTLTEQTFLNAVDWAAKRSCPLTVHLAETSHETAFIAHRKGPIATRLYPRVDWDVDDQGEGGSPVQWMTRCAPPAGTLAVHGVHVDDDDIRRLKDAGVAVALCPRSNALFGQERAPVQAYREAGVPLALGTDSLASSPSLSLWDELAFAWRWFDGELGPAEWLAIATRGGAAALGLEETLGCLEASRPANFQVVSLPDSVVMTDVHETLCREGENIQVEALYLDGENVLS